MNWLKTFWTKIVSKTSVTGALAEPEPTPVVVEEEPCGELFRIICIEAGVSQRDLDKGNVISLFEDWYAGPCTRKAVAASIDEFRKASPIGNAKLIRGKF